MAEIASRNYVETSSQIPSTPPSGSADFDRLRRVVADALAGQPDLDSDTLKDHLTALGLTGALTAVLSDAVYLHAPFARPERPLAEARAGWRELMERLRTAQQDPEEVEAARQLASDMGEESLERLRAQQHLKQKNDPLLRTIGQPDSVKSDASVEPADRGE